MKITEIWNDERTQEIFLQSLKELQSIPYVKTVDITFEYENVDDKCKFSSTIPSLRCILWLLKINLKNNIIRFIDRKKFQLFRWKF